jgi:hypothetical protein
MDNAVERGRVPVADHVQDVIEPGQLVLAEPFLGATGLCDLCG